jgi:hypothetical protein
MSLHQSITDLSEGAFVDALMDSPMRRRDLLGITGIPDDPVVEKEIALSGLPGSPKGDIDLLVWKPEAPEHSVAVQIKRVKVRIDAAGKNRINKLSEFALGVRQANLLARLGFWQVYLWVIVVVDSRELNAGAFSYAGLDSSGRSEINARVSPSELAPAAGLATYDFGQPMDHAPLHLGSGGVHLLRPATPTVQSATVTAWVQTLPQTGWARTLWCP